MSIPGEERKGKKKVLYFLEERSFAHTKYCKKEEKMWRKKACREEQTEWPVQWDGGQCSAIGWRAVQCSGMEDSAVQ